MKPIVSVLAILCALPVAVAQIEWSEPVEVAAGGGYKGPWRMNASEFHYVDDPTVAVNDAGVVGVAFANLARLDIFYQAFGPDGKPRFDAPVNVSRNPAIFSWLPRMVMTSGDPGAVYVLWQEIVFSGGSHGGEIFFARSTDGGESFEAPVNLSNSVPGDGKGRLSRRYWDNGSLDLASSPDGALYAAWTEYEGTLWLRRSGDGGKRFDAAVRVAGGNPPGPARGPSLAAGANGRVHLAFAVGEDPAANIHLATSADGGRSFAEIKALFESEGHADAPRIALDGEGALHLVYAESADGPWRRYQVRYARSTDGGKSFNEPTTVSAPDSETAAGAHFPSLDVDGDNNLYLLWERFPEPRQRSRGLGFAWSDDGGRRFSPPGVVPGSIDAESGFNGSQQGLLMRKLAVNRGGGLAVVNSTFRPGRSSHVWLIRGTLDRSNQ